MLQLGKAGRNINPYFSFLKTTYLLLKRNDVPIGVTQWRLKLEHLGSQVALFLREGNTEIFKAYFSIKLHHSQIVTLHTAW